ncbi:hypothetical protein [Nocardia macrotermitis]|uniref:DUF2637 domain-containing protein n=1 Tax=Nocardia macrotermitis TaxID=2585198 RepID=A0A7K0D8B3_9NOCA|nr:hypothetical protein [Nocardia macrotermitis]MQY21958.1 hypothetical protein [Nocardia macrotermitis]
MNGIDRIAANLESHLTITVLAVLGAVVVVVGAVWAVRSARRRGLTGEQAGTLLAAAIATGVSAQGMWVFFDKSLHLTLSLRIMFFAFLEIMVLTSALRARSAQQVSGSAGIDGVAMWVLTCLSAVLAATDADNLGTVLIRLSAPLVAAWGWERSMALERRRSGALGGINWRITPERMLIRLGIADPTDRTAGEAARQRRLIDVALAADHARTLRETGASSRRINRARHHLQRVMRRAVEDGGLVDNSRAPRTVLMDNLRILSGTGALVDLDLPSPWISEEESGGDLFATPALVAPTLAASPGVDPVAGTRPTGGANGLSGAGVVAAESSAAQQVTAEQAVLTDQTDQAGATGQVMARTHAPANSSAAQSVPPAAQSVPSGEQVSSVAQAAQGIASQSLPSDTETSSTDRSLPVDAIRQDRTGEPTPEASQPSSVDVQAPLADPTFTMPAQPLDPSQLLPATAQQTEQPLPTTTQPQDPDRTLSASARTAQPDQDSSAVTRTLPVTPPLPDAARTWQAAQTLPPNTPDETAPDDEESPDSEFADSYGPYTATAMPTASPQTGQSDSPQTNRQYRRDPAFRERVRELQAINAPTSEIAAQLGTSSRTIRRILADLDAESDGSRRQNRNPAQAAVSNWHNGFRVLPGGNTRVAPGSENIDETAAERTSRRTDRSMEK